MTIPEKYKNEPTVSLGGVDWAVPPLSGRRIIRFGALATGLAKISADMPEHEMLKIYEAIYTGVAQGLEKADPMVGEGGFELWLDSYPIKFNEIIAALPVIAKQAGMELKAVKEAPTGEASAAPIVERSF